VRAEAVLDGIFAQAVIVLEADTDRVVYQAAWETLLEDFRTDVHFSTVGGTGGIAETCRLYRTLRIPIAVIADLDMIVDREKMARVLEELVDNVDLRAALLKEINTIAGRIRSLPPTVQADEVASELAALATSPMDWTKGGDIQLKRRLGRLVRSLNRMGRLKNGGVSAYPADICDSLRDILEKLQHIGLFLVPVGELEQWLAAEKIAVSKGNKWAWANAAAHRILQLGKQSNDIWHFVSAVGRYLITTPVGGALPDKELQMTDTDGRAGYSTCERSSSTASSASSGSSDW
jgi:hypothetical protein